MSRFRTSSPRGSSIAAVGSLRRLAAFAGLVLVLAFGLAACDSGATTQIGSNGREIEVTGGSSHNVSSTPDGHLVIVDGLRIAISADAIKIGDAAPRSLSDWRRLEVQVDDGVASISVDGRALN